MQLRSFPMRFFASRPQGRTGPFGSRLCSVLAGLALLATGPVHGQDPSPLDCEPLMDLERFEHRDGVCKLSPGFDGEDWQSVAADDPAVEPIGDLYEAIQFDRRADYAAREGQLACATMEQTRQLCQDMRYRPPFGEICHPSDSINCARTTTASCHPDAEVGCRRYVLDEERMETILSTAGIDYVEDDLAVTETTETYCTGQMVGDLGYSRTRPLNRIQWQCSATEQVEYRTRVDELVAEGLPLFGWPIWSPTSSQNECRLVKALSECVLPNVGEPTRCDVRREDCTSDVAGCTSLTRGVSYSEILDRGEVDGLDLSEEEYCFRIGKVRGDYLAHGENRGIDFNNGQTIGQWNSGTLNSPSFPAQTNIPPDFVSIMEACGFTWGGRWFDAAIDTDPISEGCDPMHFELPNEVVEAGKVDVVVVADNTGSMRDDLAALRASAVAIAERLGELGGDFRLGLVTFNDPAVRLVLPPSSDPQAFVDAIDSVGASGGGDFPEHVYGGLMEAISQPWREDAARGIVLIGDAPPKDPEPGTGFTLESVVAAALAGGGAAARAPSPSLPNKVGRDAIRIVSVQVGSNSATRFYFQALADRTEGRWLVAPTANEVVEAVLDALAELSEPTNQPPDVSAARPSANQLWPPNHSFHEVGILDVVDPDGDPVRVEITAVYQDEPVSDGNGNGNGNGNGSGDTSPDAEGVGGSSALLRAERHGGGDGRVYHVEFLADDGRGGTTAGTVTVCVPHDRRHGGSCGDGGPLFDSTRP